MNLSFSMKVVGLVLVTVLFLSGTIFGLTYYFVSKGFEDQAQKEISLLSTSVQAILDDCRDKVMGVAHSLAIRPDVAKANDSHYGLAMRFLRRKGVPEAKAKALIARVLIMDKLAPGFESK